LPSRARFVHGVPTTNREDMTVLTLVRSTTGVGGGEAMTVEYFLLVCDDVPHDVVLTDPGARVIDVAQVIRRLTGLSLWRSKVLATQAPAVILNSVPEEAAVAAVSALRDAGAEAELSERSEWGSWREPVFSQVP
ncbi:ribosomal protein L7/L12, partial [Streptomyces chartreusis]|uniref:ribosomal protein L7/L12 n=1 Tax=Streptomyces chartreusis TaxID=1969 RepID=UPI0035E31AC3